MLTLLPEDLHASKMQCNLLSGSPFFKFLPTFFLFLFCLIFFLKQDVNIYFVFIFFGKRQTEKQINLSFGGRQFCKEPC